MYMYLSEGATVGEHRRASDRDAHDRTVPVGGVLDIGRRVVGEPRGRHPVLGRLAQMLGHEPVELRPALERHDLAGRRLRQALQARLAGQRDLWRTMLGRVIDTHTNCARAAIVGGILVLLLPHARKNRVVNYYTMRKGTLFQFC